MSRVGVPLLADGEFWRAARFFATPPMGRVDSAVFYFISEVEGG
ncbi:hypothetical protein [Archangium lansingense]|uniref:Uncharacterized protein n=1 Tax=Archangium lansingense TaxID=2995310 RepID=A0ABT4A8C9_9BACT|nr:hypothetical protein [Archangium lansinium]MCY1077910.1 hypothetical protein [Archangium lansinium]